MFFPTGKLRITLCSLQDETRHGRTHMYSKVVLRHLFPASWLAAMILQIPTIQRVGGRDMLSFVRASDIAFSNIRISTGGAGERWWNVNPTREKERMGEVKYGGNGSTYNRISIKVSHVCMSIKSGGRLLGHNSTWFASKVSILYYGSGYALTIRYIYLGRNMNTV